MVSSRRYACWRPCHDHKPAFPTGPARPREPPDQPRPDGAGDERPRRPPQRDGRGLVESGRDTDKFTRHGIKAVTGPVLGMPLIEAGCSAWLECRLIPERHTEDAYDTCFAEVVSAAADARIFSRGRWEFREDNLELQTIHHLGGGNFVRAGGVIRG
jgi:hypothetical protein